MSPVFWGNVKETTETTLNDWANELPSSLAVELEYLSAKILNLAGNTARDSRKSRVKPTVGQHGNRPGASHRNTVAQAKSECMDKSPRNGLEPLQTPVKNIKWHTLQIRWD